MLQYQDFRPANLTISDPLHHIFNEEDCYALWAAYAAGRPLLVRGKPGVGKSQMARAIAAQLGWAFVSETIHGNTELSDLHWHFDAIGRLGEAQARAMTARRGATPASQLRHKDPLDPLNFLSPGAFWWAYDWDSALRQYHKCRTRLRPQPPTTSDWKNKGVVLLLDEMDKAEPDLPNGLLETLGNFRFSVPYLNACSTGNGAPNPIQAKPQKLLVIITTNEERELPQAFVRRCFVHTLKMEISEAEETIILAPTSEKITLQKRYAWLIKRGYLHFGERIAEAVYLEAAEQLWQDRNDSQHNPYPPGLAEYIDLLTALAKLDSHTEQIQRLQNIKRYALQKKLEQ